MLDVLAGWRILRGNPADQCQCDNGECDSGYDIESHVKVVVSDFVEIRVHRDKGNGKPCWMNQSPDPKLNRIELANATRDRTAVQVSSSAKVNWYQAFFMTMGQVKRSSYLPTFPR